MNEILSWFAVQGYLPHGYCFQWSSTLLTLIIVGNLMTALAYYSIPLALLVFLDRWRSMVKVSWVFVLFAAFIFLCGTTHMIHIVTIWYPVYWLQGWVTLITGLVSIATAVLLWPMIAKASTILQPAANAEVESLKAEVERLKAELAEKA